MTFVDACCSYNWEAVPVRSQGGSLGKPTDLGWVASDILLWRSESSPIPCTPFCLLFTFRFVSQSIPKLGFSHEVRLLWQLSPPAQQQSHTSYPCNGVRPNASHYTTRTTSLSDLKTVFRSNFFQIWPRNRLLNFLAGLDCSYLPAQNMFWRVQENQYPIVNPIQSSFYRKEHSQSVSVGVSPNKGRTPPVFKVNVSEPLR